jgi:hypothetical protein
MCGSNAGLGIMRHEWLVLIWVFVCLTLPGEVFSGASNMRSLVPKEPPVGWALSGSPQVFTKKTLFEHIDGQADLFLQYGFKKSIFAVYRNKNSSRDKIDVDIYDMGDVVHAFGIFSRFRQEGRSAGIGLASYLEDSDALFYKGKYFVVLQATESNSSRLKQLAETIESRITDSSLPPKEIGYFPKRGLKPDSTEYYPQGLMGHQFLKKGFKATYLVQGKTNVKREAAAESPDSSLFLAVFDNPQEAQSALKNFKEDLSKRGSAQAANPTQLGFEILKGQDAYQGRIIVVQKGRYLAGAAGFEREKDAQGLLAELIKQIE